MKQEDRIGTFVQLAKGITYTARLSFDLGYIYRGFIVQGFKTCSIVKNQNQNIAVLIAHALDDQIYP